MIEKIKNSTLSKFIATVLALNILLVSSVSANNKVTLNAGTPVILETTTHINAEVLIPGITIDFRVKYDVVVDQKVVIPAGSIAKGQVTRLQKAKGLGKPGYVEIRVNDVVAKDGQMIPLAGSSLYAEGEEKQDLAIILGIVVCIFFLAIKGTDPSIPAGTQLNVATAGTVYINVGSDIITKEKQAEVVNISSAINESSEESAVADTISKDSAIGATIENPIAE